MKGRFFVYVAVICCTIMTSSGIVLADEGGAGTRNATLTRAPTQAIAPVSRCEHSVSRSPADQAVPVPDLPGCYRYFTPEYGYGCQDDPGCEASLCLYTGFEFDGCMVHYDTDCHCANDEYCFPGWE